MPSTRSDSAPRRSSRGAELEKKKQQLEKKAKSTATKAARALKPKVDKAKQEVKKEVKKVVKKVAAKVEQKAKAKAPSTSKKPSKPSKPSAPAKSSKPAPVKRGPPKERGAVPTAEEQKEFKAAKKETAATAKSATKKVASKVATAASGSSYKEGDSVEDITLKNDSDQDVTLSSLYNESGLVIFTYPKANTPGCTTQSCNYRDIKSEFESLGYKVVGLSRDSPKSQSSWKTKHDFKYDLLCDPEAQLLKKLGATEKDKRCHFVIEKGGKLLEAKVGVKPADDAKNALDFVKSRTDKKD